MFWCIERAISRGRSKLAKQGPTWGKRRVLVGEKRGKIPQNGAAHQGEGNPSRESVEDEEIPDKKKTVTSAGGVRTG